MEYLRGPAHRAGAAPRNLARLPHHAQGARRRPDDVVGGPRAAARLADRGALRAVAASGHAVSAEKGALREVGNLVFHFASSGCSVAIAVGKIVGYEGQVIVMADGGEFCNAGIRLRQVPARPARRRHGPRPVLRRRRRSSARVPRRRPDSLQGRHPLPGASRGSRRRRLAARRPAR